MSTASSDVGTPRLSYLTSNMPVSCKREKAELCLEET